MWQKFLKSTHRREPITSFFLTMALVELVIGGLEQELPLLGLAVVMAGGSIALRYCAGSRSGSHSGWRSVSVINFSPQIYGRV